MAYTSNKWFPNFGREKYFDIHPHKETLRHDFASKILQDLFEM